MLSQRFTSKKIRTKGVKHFHPAGDVLRERLAQTKKSIFHLTEDALDRTIAKEYHKRLKVYDALEWYVGDVDIDEVKVWKGTGGLYATWTERCSLKETAEKLSRELLSGRSRLGRRRAMCVVPEIMQIKEILQNDPCLMPIIVPNGTYGTQRGGIRTIRWFLDDGCMRSLAYAVSGDAKIRAYIGMPMKKSSD